MTGSPADMPARQPRAMTKTDDSGGRLYVHPGTGEEFPSVTTILGSSAKPALDRWRVRTISEFAADHRESLASMERDAAFDMVRSSQYTSSGAAAATGEAVHSRLEVLFGVLRDRGDSAAVAEIVADPAPPGLSHVDKCFVELLREFEVRPLYMENTLVNRAVWYAGSADLIAEIRRRGSGSGWRRAVIDAKSGKSIYGSVALQLVGYAKAEAILLPDGSEVPMPPIHETYALHVRPKSWAIRPMRYDARVWRAFRSLVDVSGWLREERDAVGDAINGGAIARKRSYNARYSAGGSAAA